jgi:very-short-patch-repair endonuclease
MTRIYNKAELKDTRRKLRKEQTYAEKTAWMVLRDRNSFGCKFRRQYSVDRYIIDFYSPELKLAIELDGGIHNEPEQKRYDVERQKYLEAIGITFLRFTNEEFVDNGDYAENKIKETIKKLTSKGI